MDRQDLPQHEIQRVFEVLGLGTQLQRDRFLSFGEQVPLQRPAQILYVTSLSNGSAVQNDEGTNRARLDQPAQ